VTVVAKTKGKRVALYLRVSTSEQTTHNQQRELQAVADRHKWDVVGVFEDAGISGAKGREQRPGLDAMMKVVSLREVDMVAAWSVDRLGRSLIDLLGFLGELHSKGVDLFLHQQGLDTSTPSGRAMFQMMGVFAEFERAMIRASAEDLWRQVFANLAKHANATLMDPSYDPTADEAGLRDELAHAGWSASEIDLRIRLFKDDTAAAPVTSGLDALPPQSLQEFIRIRDSIMSAI
jgi:DNA invertase Pin-like site-specific DNA recombinase